MREMPLDEYTAAVAAFTGREPDEKLRAACAIAQEKAQTLAEVWPLIGFLFTDEPEVDEKAWKKVMRDGSGELLGASLEALREVDPFDVEPIERAPERRSVEQAGQTGQGLPADPRGDHGHLGFAWNLRIAGRARARALDRADRAGAGPY